MSETLFVIEAPEPNMSTTVSTQTEPHELNGTLPKPSIECCTQTDSILHKTLTEGMDKLNYKVCSICDKELPSLSCLAIHTIMHQINVPCEYPQIESPKCKEENNGKPKRKLRIRRKNAVTETKSKAPRLIMPATLKPRPLTLVTSLTATALVATTVNVGISEPATAEEAELECPICSVHVTKSSMAAHIKTHKTDKSHKCLVCEKSFTTKRYLTQHMTQHNRRTTRSSSAKEECNGSVEESIETMRVQVSTPNNNEKDETEESADDGNDADFNFENMAGYSDDTDFEENLTCQQCDKEFSSKSSLNSHMKVHSNGTESKQYPCTMCHKKFRGAEYLKNHLEKHKLNRTNKSVNKFECNICKKQLASKSSLWVHQKTHRGDKPFECKVCGMKFALKSYITRHMVKHGLTYDTQDEDESKKTSENIKQVEGEDGSVRFECQICKKQLARKGTLIEHLKTHETGTQYSCEICNAIFSVKRYLQRHMVRHTGSRPLRKRAQPKPKEAQTEATKEKRNVECPICNKQLRIQSLQKHMGTHQTEKPFQCEVCGVTFSLKLYLKKHMVKHSSEKPFVCDQCGKAFKTKNELTAHVRTHSKEKPFSCNTCGNRFSCATNLRLHMRIHTGEKNFQCHVCARRFTFRSGLNFHLKMHSNIRPHKCPYCDKGYIKRNDLASHIRTHTQERPFKCHTCQKGFFDSSHLKRHLRVHLEVKPYVCHQCGKYFTQNSNLEIHMRTHTGEKPYECNVCGRRFAHKSSLTPHLKAHESNDGRGGASINRMPRERMPSSNRNATGNKVPGPVSNRITGFGKRMPNASPRMPVAMDRITGTVIDRMPPPLEKIPGAIDRINSMDRMNMERMPINMDQRMPHPIDRMPHPVDSRIPPNVTDYQRLQNPLERLSCRMDQLPPSMAPNPLERLPCALERMPCALNGIPTTAKYFENKGPMNFEFM